jgi:pimeloyl-ACP methyl ester carboxylesterase
MPGRSRCAAALAFALALALALALSGTAAGAGPSDGTSPDRTSPDGAIAWRGCGNHLQCGTVTVPVDYAQPSGPSVAIAVARRPATDRARRLGAVVVNFGGPGDAGTQTLRDFVPELPAEIRSRFDVVSFDPRGTGSSRPVVCVTNAQADALAAQDPTSNGPSDLRAFYDDSNAPVDLDQGCIDRNGPWLADVGTRDVARDMDRIRAALGEQRLDYLGYSYGTVLGAVYAQMYPSRVGRFVLDSPVDLSSNAQQGLEDDAAGFEHALDRFLSDCASRSSCPFHSHGDPAAALRTLQQRFEAGLTVPTFDSKGHPSARRLGVGGFYTAIISALYDRAFGWPALAQGLAQARAGNGGILQVLADEYNGRHDDGTYDNISEVIGVILCDDRPDAVPTFDQFVAEHDALARRYPFLGNLVGSTPVGCDPRLPRPPASEAVGEVRVAGIPHVLVVGTTADPATPYAGAIDLEHRLAGSRLLTFVSTEHTAYPKSSCVDAAVDGYLERGALPRAVTRCSS